MNDLVVIPARGGSKGIPGKNIKMLNGKPLIHYSIEVAREVFADEQILVSTDSPAIRDVAEQTGLDVPFLRPSALATDSAGSYEVLLHALARAEEQGMDPSRLILLQPTSPFRQARHVKEAMDLFSTDCEMVVSVKVADGNPYYNLREEDDFGWLQKFKEADNTRRQDIPEVYQFNGAVYVINIAALRNRTMIRFDRVRKYLMDPYYSLDLDTPLDWHIAECLMKSGFIDAG
ncbi:MAG: acylneuraminate cytidylyltransferase family protein [Bacteroidia bacterium]